jgi:putative ABC transport system permease protein
MIGVTVAFAAGYALAGGLIAESVEHSLRISMARLGADLMVVPANQDTSIKKALLTGEPTSFYMPDDVVDRVADMSGVANASPQLFVESLSNASCCSGRFFLIGFLTSWMRQTMKGQRLSSNEIIIGHEISLKLRDKVKFFGMEFTVAGILDKTGMGLDWTIFIPISDVRRMINDSPTKAIKPLTIRSDQISAILVKVEPGIFPQYLAKDIVAELGDVNVILQTEFVKSIYRRLSTMMNMVQRTAISIWILVIPLVGTIFSMVVDTRKKEIGLLRAMGARRTFVFRLVLTECCLLYILGFMTGAIGGGLVVFNFRALIATSLQAPFLWPPFFRLLHLVLCLLVGVVCAGCLAGLVPAIRNSRMELHDALRVVV